MNLKSRIDEIPDFPKKGILFRDISPLLRDPSALSLVIDEFTKIIHPNDVDVFAGIESRGFPLACALALKYNKGMIMIRKQGKLPGVTHKTTYNIEYGSATMEIQTNAIKKGQKVYICDDLLATGGTAKAAANLVEKIGGNVAGFAFIIELTDLKGSKSIKGYKYNSLVKY
ncbi:adenine phosphoribosyltransferase [Candidatus Nitrosotalea okcheonensis]|uniref:Adenine phosphoribosyltransferase n=1 Tax=Candidatus Nitrosotalea okcheonensis TaxID=1903276 RepID=A0A2H1FFR8_9ARCH|nr:adenine phosphoribosyltransferase [Candidatus Nitrosotalea okcheonensis]MDE1728212.1 adenine phosphoribosyltransferase [Nitrososphaerota archaeon]MDE1831302.1 adenine phosphoribosyltransferase [Nitrososphaerota archaeon]MDE1840784.1 adenine phosphoribosyltransferase [Nitrososphaerota archaeon]MDE1878135.1 adenine phosphoribosyltransferase [Nitrososphaerota archaeon]SMH71619.1 Adenine phosphoribosyltransferase [Candidatus Nitrosotalea okcheonensis]